MAKKHTLPAADFISARELNVLRASEALLLAKQGANPASQPAEHCPMLPHHAGSIIDRDEITRLRAMALALRTSETNTKPIGQPAGELLRVACLLVLVHGALVLGWVWFNVVKK